MGERGHGFADDEVDLGGENICNVPVGRNGNFMGRHQIGPIRRPERPHGPCQNTDTFRLFQGCRIERLKLILCPGAV